MMKFFLKRTAVLFLIFSWLLFGWPPLWPTNFPPKVKVVRAATLTYVGGAKATGDSASFSVSLTALTGGIASSPSAGDIVVVSTGFVSTANGDPGVTTTGYTEVADLYANDTRDANLSIDWKIMGATPDTSVTCNGSGSTTNGAACVVQVWRNVDQAVPLDVTTTTATSNNAATPNSPAITPITSGAVVLSLVLGTEASVDTSVTAPTGYGNQIDTTVDPGNALVVGIASKSWSGSGAEDPAAWTNFTTTTSDSWAAGTVALRPANSAPNAPSQDSPLNLATGVSLTPTFLLTATDPESNNLGYRVAIYSDSGCSVVVGAIHDQSTSSTGWTGMNATCTASPTSCYSSGTQASFALQSSDALTANTQYWWKAGAKDSDGSGSFTNSSTCNSFTTGIVSVTVSDGGVSYGTLAASTTKDTTSTGLNDTQTATNNGTIAEDFNIKGQNSTNWTLAATSGADQYVHSFSLTGGAPWTVLTTNYQSIATNITANGTKVFDLQITTPSSTSTYTQQSVDVTIQAVAH